MPWYICENCQSLEKCGETYFWVDHGYGNPALCSACDPHIGHWHGKFPQGQPAVGLLVDSQGLLWYPHELMRGARYREIVGIVQGEVPAVLLVGSQQDTPPQRAKKHRKRSTRERKVKA